MHVLFAHTGRGQDGTTRNYLTVAASQRLEGWKMPMLTVSSELESPEKYDAREDPV